MKAKVLKDISPLIQKGDILIKRGKFGILKGHNKMQRVFVKKDKNIFTPPNFYSWETIENLTEYYQIIT